LKKSGGWKVGSICSLIVAASLATPSIAMQGDTIADIVLGQSGFSQTPQPSISAHGLHGPIAAAIDTSVVPNRLYVTDFGNNRILGYKDVATLMNGGAADLVIGQSSFSSNLCTNHRVLQSTPAAISTSRTPQTAGCSNTIARSLDAARSRAWEGPQTGFSARADPSSPANVIVVAGRALTPYAARWESHWIRMAISTSPTKATTGCSNTILR
jgi:hypothetical protein